VEQGDLAFVREWLKTNIHSLGKRYDSEQLAKHVTGKPFSADAYCAYLKKKYGDIYRF
jgi:carboxypeptidase Taq